MNQKKQFEMLMCKHLYLKFIYNKRRIVKKQNFITLFFKGNPDSVIRVFLIL